VLLVAANEVGSVRPVYMAFHARLGTMTWQLMVPTVSHCPAGRRRRFPADRLTALRPSREQPSHPLQSASAALTSVDW